MPSEAGPGEEDEDTHEASVSPSPRGWASSSRSSSSSAGSRAVRKLVSTASLSFSASRTLRILRAARPASSATGFQVKERPARSRVTTPLSSSRVRIVMTVV